MPFLLTTLSIYPGLRLRNFACLWLGCHSLFHSLQWWIDLLRPSHVAIHLLNYQHALTFHILGWTRMRSHYLFLITWMIYNDKLISKIYNCHESTHIVWTKGYSTIAQSANGTLISIRYNLVLFISHGFVEKLGRELFSVCNINFSNIWATGELPLFGFHRAKIPDNVFNMNSKSRALYELYNRCRKKNVSSLC